MPTYEYACRTCGEHLEVVQAFSDVPLEVCPACGGSLRKVFGNVGIVFKGSGFYKTDNRQSASAGSGSASASNGAEAAHAGDSSGTKEAAPKADGTTSSTKEPSAPTSSPAPSVKPVAAAS